MISDTAHPSSDARLTKRLRRHPPDHSSNYNRLLSSANDSNDMPKTPFLPEKMWALVMDFLPYQSVLSSAAVSRAMLRETMPLVTMLHLDSSAQLHAGVASLRYRDVRDIYIYSLLRYSHVDEDDEVDEPDMDDDEGLTTQVDADTAVRAVPFLCHFPKLERVFLGGRRPNGRVEGFICSGDIMDEDRERMTTLIDAFSGAFRARALANNLWVLGLRCPRSSRTTNMFSDSTCLTCRAACRSFPLESVADFECEGSSCKNLTRHSFYYSEKLYSLDVCLRREKIEEIIVKERLGGRDSLYSEARFLSLLGRGTRKIVVPDEGKELFVVKYSEDELGDIRRCIVHSRMNVKMLSSVAVTDAIMRSFAEDERDPLPPRDQCYLAQNSFYDLRSLGLVIDEANFLNADEWDGKKHDSIHPVQLFSNYNWRFT
jgi:hypothetical protein